MGNEKPLTIEDVTRVSVDRCYRWHGSRGLNVWTLSDWGLALAGETGELCNVVKKLNRLRDGIAGNKSGETEETLQAALGEEAADVFLYLVLFAAAAGINFPEAIRAKFNAVSERIGALERL